MMVNGDYCPEKMKSSSKHCKKDTLWSTGVSCSCFIIYVLVLVHMYIQSSHVSKSQRKGTTRKLLVSVTIARSFNSGFVVQVHISSALRQLL